MGSIALLNDVVIVMVPFPLQGHLNQLLHLSRLIATAATDDLPVHFVASLVYSRQARRRLYGGCDSLLSITFHEVPFPPSDPDDAPIHLQPMSDLEAAALRRPVSDLLRRLCATSRRVVVVYDSLMGSVVQDLADHPNAEAYTFHSVSAYTIFFFLWENLGRPFPVDPRILANLPSLDGCFTPEFAEFIRKQHEYLRLSSGRIYNTSRVIEDSFLDLLSRSQINRNKKQFALGPFNPFKSEPESESKSSPRHRSLEWLDGRAPDSTILVSFGTTTTLSVEQVSEIAAGLERSGVGFVWVLQNADHRKIREIELPSGFEERVKGRGIVIRDWAPQLGILGHAATGGFLSHCGWNSCMESISMGVPIAAWPVHSDQPRNAALVTTVLGVGLAVNDWGRRLEIVAAEALEGAIRRLMASEEGKGMRRRASELGAAVRRAVTAEGGATRREMDVFITHITR